MQSRPAVQHIPPYAPGLRLPGKIKMASNENPLGPSPAALAALAGHAAELNLYPDGSARPLCEAIARHRGLEPGQVIVGNGSDEVIFFAAATFLNPGDQILIADHTFSEYRFSATIMDGTVQVVPLRHGAFDLEAFLAALSPRTRIIFLCSPNNPTGTIIPQADLAAFLDRLPPEVLVLVDQAYAEFADNPAYGDVPALIGRYPNLLVTRTFSKLYGLAGLRLGYGLGPAGLISQMMRIKPPFNTSLAAQAAGLAALEDRDFVDRSLALNREGRAWIQAGLDRLGLPYYPSQANFVCLDTLRDGRQVFEHILEQGIIVRPCGSFGLPSCIRISVGTMEQNRRFMTLLEQALAAIPAGGAARCIP